ncbi:MAG: hypothetical protein HY758_06600 [Nitrospirae bacterium]|nr:hypothetical protein [Nitrospirota bacterium]
MNKTEQEIIEVLEGLSMLLNSHKSAADLVEFRGTEAVIQLSGDCAECTTNCIEDYLYSKIDGVEFFFI